MPAETQSFKTYLGKTENLYEAALIIAKRARQINEELYQKKRDQQILEELEGEIEDDFLHNEDEKLEMDESVELEENPIVTAQREFLEDSLDYQFEPRKK